MTAAAGGIAEAAAGETPGRPFMDLVASLPTTIYTLYGVADMHLSYVVFRFPFEGGEFPHYVAEAVVALGAACSAANLDTPLACLQVCVCFCVWMCLHIDVCVVIYICMIYM
jgi:hypothetical protein